MPIVSKSYKKTVRCSYCRQSGHNKSSCPQYAARIEEIRADYGDDHYAVVDFDNKKSRRKAAAKSRKCSYCLEGGHNRKTCAALKEHMVITKQRNIEYRKSVFQAMVNHGMFAGAIVTTDRNLAPCNPADPKDRKKYKVPMVITKVMWSDINIWETEFQYFTNDITNRAPFRMLPFDMLRCERSGYALGFVYDYDMNYNKMQLEHFQRYDQPEEECGYKWYSKYKDYYFPTIVSRVDAQKPPLGWLTCDDEETAKALKEFYKKCNAEHGPYRGRDKNSKNK